MTGVRTPTHKLLKYRDHPEWTELFDLAADPYETKNLFNDPKHAEVRAKLEKEHDRLAKELDAAQAGRLLHEARPCGNGEVLIASRGTDRQPAYFRSRVEIARPSARCAALACARGYPRPAGATRCWWRRDHRSSRVGQPPCLWRDQLTPSLAKDRLNPRLFMPPTLVTPLTNQPRTAVVAWNTPTGIGLVYGAACSRRNHSSSAPLATAPGQSAA